MVLSSCAKRTRDFFILNDNKQSEPGFIGFKDLQNFKI
jgi:hypothetical protein